MFERRSRQLHAFEIAANRAVRWRAGFECEVGRIFGERGAMIACERRHAEDAAPREAPSVRWMWSHTAPVDGPAFRATSSSTNVFAGTRAGRWALSRRDARGACTNARAAARGSWDGARAGGGHPTAPRPGGRSSRAARHRARAARSRTAHRNRTGRRNPARLPSRCDRDARRLQIPAIGSRRSPVVASMRRSDEPSRPSAIT